MGSKIDREGFRDSRAICDQIVEALVSCVVLQLVDDGKAAIVEHDDDELFGGQDSGVNIGVHQQIGPVTDKDDSARIEFFLALRDACAPAACNLITHAGKAKFDVNSAKAERTPVGGDFCR